MKALVIKPYIDKEKGKFYRAGQSVDASDKRIDELALAGVVKPIVETKAAKESTRKSKTTKE